MSTFNSEKTVKEAVDSVLRQSFQDFEIILVDDGSTDHTISVIQKIGDPRVKIVGNSKNRGVPFALNQAIASRMGCT